MRRFIGIDPSSKTGFVIQDENGIVLEEEIYYKYENDPERMNYIVEYILSNINKETDTLCIEGFSFQSKGRGISFQFGLGWIIRNELKKANINYYEVTPGQLKKFASGNGKATKKELIEPIKQKFNYYHPSDNITDAFILSEIAKGLVNYKSMVYNKEDLKIIKDIIKSPLNSYELKETKISPWQNKNSKYYFTRN